MLLNVALVATGIEDLAPVLTGCPPKNRVVGGTSNLGLMGHKGAGQLNISTGLPFGRLTFIEPKTPPWLEESPLEEPPNFCWVHVNLQGTWFHVSTGENKPNTAFREAGGDLLRPQRDGKPICFEATPVGCEERGFGKQPGSENEHLVVLKHTENTMGFVSCVPLQFFLKGLSTDFNIDNPVFGSETSILGEHAVNPGSFVGLLSRLQRYSGFLVVSL